MNREEIDQFAYDLICNNKNILLQWATGCGKTKQAITAIDMLDKNNHNNVLIVVAERAHKKNWINEFERWSPNLLNNPNYSIQLICYDSLHHFTNEIFDLVIFDESHHLGTDIKLNLLANINSNKIIMLSATMDEKLIAQISSIIGDIAISSISLQNAIDWGIISEPKIILVPMKLDNTIANQTIEEVRGNKDKLVTVRCSVAQKWMYLKDKKRYPNLKLLISCTERQKYNDFDMKIEYYKKSINGKRAEYSRNKMLQYGLQRKTFLGSLKDAKAKEIISTFGKSRYICFCNNIEQADMLGGTHSINYKKDDPQSIIDAFNDKKINSLFVVGMLKEGQNLNNIEKGLIIQLDGKILPFIQKSGRVLRASDPEIYIIYFQGTQDEIYLNKALEDINPNYIRYYEDHDR